MKKTAGMNFHEGTLVEILKAFANIFFGLFMATANYRLISIPLINDW